MTPVLKSIISVVQTQYINILFETSTPDQNGTCSLVRGWTRIHGSSLETWINSNPNSTILRIFPDTADMIDRYKELQNNPNLNAKFNIGDKFKNAEDELVEFLGFNPRNRKYKCIIYNHSRGKRFKISMSYLESMTKI